jgi:threonine dehydratase
MPDSTSRPPEASEIELEDYGVSLADVHAAARAIAGAAHITPVMSCGQIDELAHARLFFKCEQFQKVGAFKFRGAYNALSQIAADPAAVQRGVITHSSGNHAQALALAARLFGIPATVVMPDNALPVKRAAVAGYGATVVLCEPTLAAREETVARLRAQSAAQLVHPYDDPRIIAGQATAALELLTEVPDLDAIVAPIGGGGLISGTAIATKSTSRTTRVIGAEPSGADDAFRSKQASQLMPQTNPRTIADGLLTSLGRWTWPIVRDWVDAIVTVSDAEIRSAQRLLWERAKLLTEPSSATALAAVLRPGAAGLPRGARIGIILSGGNVDLDKIAW